MPLLRSLFNNFGVNWPWRGHYLNHCWLAISEVQLHSLQDNFARDTSSINHSNQFENYSPTISFESPRSQWVQIVHKKMGKTQIYISWGFFCLFLRYGSDDLLQEYIGSMAPPTDCPEIMWPETEILTIRNVIEAVSPAWLRVVEIESYCLTVSYFMNKLFYFFWFIAQRSTYMNHTVSRIMTAV